MATVAKHYESHLARVYSWMVGDVEAAVARGAAELAALGLPRTASDLVVDLGAGIGLHSIALARAGCAVIAIDGSERLLDELRARAGWLPITTLTADLQDFSEHLDQSPDLILCMGDTLTHLPGQPAIEALFSAVDRSLDVEGTFVTTFRDYTAAPLEGDQRFIPVRSDSERIHTCFLEYDDDTVLVHDLLHERTDAGWRQTISNYRKLRLSPHWVSSTLETRGFTVDRSVGPGGMVCLVARRR